MKNLDKVCLLYILQLLGTESDVQTMRLVDLALLLPLDLVLLLPREAGPVTARGHQIAEDADHRERDQRNDDTHREDAGRDTDRGRA